LPKLGEDDPRMIRATIEHGAMGCVPKSSTPEILIGALRLILAHGVYLPLSALDSNAVAPISPTQRKSTPTRCCDTCRRDSSKSCVA
jgi:DNA-binding NarL/FixJ family response regulator